MGLIYKGDWWILFSKLTHDHTSLGEDVRVYNFNYLHECGNCMDLSYASKLD
jgi:hypothetical protein